MKTSALVSYYVLTVLLVSGERFVQSMHVAQSKYAMFDVKRPDPKSWKRTKCGSPGNATLGQPDLPSRWGREISADTTPLVKYPRPQMVRLGSDHSVASSNDALRDVGDQNTWTNLNGLWEFQATSEDGLKEPPFGRSLNSTILVPFPVESCLSGVAPQSSADVVQYMWYRLDFEVTERRHASGQRTLLHFGAVDWQSTVFVNGKMVANNTGGYNSIDVDVTDYIFDSRSNELLVHVYDPSDTGSQPNGKQRISAIDAPGGDTYTPSSGIWQTVWMETVPLDAYISDVRLEQNSATTLNVSGRVIGGNGDLELTYEVRECGSSRTLAKASAPSDAWTQLSIPNATLWSPQQPYLYDLFVSTGNDTVLSYFGLRTFELGHDAEGTTRPMLNGEFTFLTGFLDQSFWPDGLYTAPTDEALAYDVRVLSTFGMNLIRLHQKINPERWYYHADLAGIVVFQDMVQKYGGASKDTVPLFVDDMERAIRGRKSHPCIVQFTTFNEGDCWNVFTEKPWDVAGVVDFAQSLAPFHLIDTDSGGGANDLHIGSVNDIHDYPNPKSAAPSRTQYAMVGEFGGIGAFVRGKQWLPGMCHTYLKVDTPAEEASTYVGMMRTIATNLSSQISAAVYTQTTDVELECDGFLNYDRSSKFNASETASIRIANRALW